MIGSVDVGRRTAADATAAVQGAYFAPVALQVGHRGYSVSPHHFHTVLPLGAAIQTALTAPADTSVPLTPTLDMKLVAKWVTTLAGETDRAPVAGRVVLRHNRPFVLSAPGVGIHGTDEPWSIGHSESHGCIRMQVPSAEWLYNRVQVGTPVFIISA